MVLVSKRSWIFWTGLLAPAAFACACGEAEPQSAAARGAKIYANVCIVCHHADPNLDGSVGPALAGSSYELLEARLLRGEYPPGYTPKRETQAMPPLPHLADYIGDIAAFLAEAAQAQPSAASAGSSKPTADPTAPRTARSPE
jgi:mono/diheme cytochrome c family protein